MIDGWKAIGQPRGMQIWVGEIAAAWQESKQFIVVTMYDLCSDELLVTSGIQASRG
jgi:hypothetical protein